MRRMGQNWLNQRMLLIQLVGQDGLNIGVWEMIYLPCDPVDGAFDMEKLVDDLEELDLSTS